MWIELTIIVLIYLIYSYVIKPASYWKHRNVPYKKPWPVFGSMLPIVLVKKSFFELLNDWYNDEPNERFTGLHQFMKPLLFIRDLELIKQITIKDFNFFINRTPHLNSDSDPIISKALTSLEDEKWRTMRATLSPSFTGSKMKFLFNLVNDCALQFTKYYESQDSDVIDVEMKDTSSRFANDVIATSAFGITTDSLNQKDNEFFTNGQNATKFGGWRAILFLVYILIPPLKKILKIPIFSPEIVKFFQGIIDETVEIREKNKIVRPDVIHLLLESRKHAEANTEKGTNTTEEGNVQIAKITNDDITAQSILFFFAGFDTVSALASFMSYELALNRDVQTKLQQEIDDVLEKCDEKLTYDQIAGMKYMDMVVSESLRKWPPGIALDRVCGHDYVIEGRTETEKSVIIEKGTTITIPVVAIHRDPKYFPDPEKFDPERFSEENKSNIVPFSYMPFGLGPRNCVASRFALMESKILFFHLLSKFNIVQNEKTPIPLILSKYKVTLVPDEGFCVGFQKRV